MIQVKQARLKRPSRPKVKLIGPPSVIPLGAAKGKWIPPLPAQPPPASLLEAPKEDRAFVQRMREAALADGLRWSSDEEAEDNKDDAGGKADRDESPSAFVSGCHALDVPQPSQSFHGVRGRGFAKEP